MTKTRRVMTVAGCALLLATTGCNWLRADRSHYKEARETRPLEIPPDLDSPSAAAELTIPGSGSAAPRASSAASPAATPPMESGAPRPASAQTYSGTETSLVLTDEVASAFRRVSLALERSGVMSIVGKDEGAATVTLKQDTVTKEGGFLKRMVGRGGTKTETVTRVVRVIAEGAGSRVNVEDESGHAIDDESARQIIAAVKQRLG